MDRRVIEQRIKLAKKRLRGLPTSSGHYRIQMARIQKLEAKLPKEVVKPERGVVLEDKIAAAVKKVHSKATRKTTKPSE